MTIVERFVHCVQSTCVRGVFTDGDSVLSTNDEDSQSRRRTVNGESEKMAKVQRPN
jgi:hypothetical protein